MHIFTKTIAILRKVKNRCLKRNNTFNYSEKVQSICTAKTILTFVEVTKKKRKEKKPPKTPKTPIKKESIYWTVFKPKSSMHYLTFIRF